MSDDYLWDKSGPPDPEIAHLEKALGSLRHDGEWKEPPAAASPPVQAVQQVHEVKAAPSVSPSPHADNVRPIGPVRRPFRRVAWAVAGTLALAAAVWLAIDPWGGRPNLPPKQAQIVPTVSTSSPATARSAPPSPSTPGPCTSPPEGFPFKVASAQGASPAEASCAGAPVSSGKLPVDTWLETPADTTVDLTVADIGALTLRGGSRLRIVRTGTSEHRLELVRGSLHAKVVAPPRLFVIDTRAATAVDLGCEYDLSVDDAGRTHLTVVKGAVSLEGPKSLAFVPRNSEVTATPDRGPGAVLALTATAALRAAVLELDATADDATALTKVLSLTEKTDSVTLWNLLANATKSTRPAIVSRIEDLGLRPKTISRTLLTAGDRPTIDALRETFEDTWYPPTPAAPPSTSAKAPAPTPPLSPPPTSTVSPTTSPLPSAPTPTRHW